LKIAEQVLEITESWNENTKEWKSYYESEISPIADKIQNRFQFPMSKDVEEMERSPEMSTGDFWRLVRSKDLPISFYRDEEDEEDEDRVLMAVY